MVLGVRVAGWIGHVGIDTPRDGLDFVWLGDDTMGALPFRTIGGNHVTCAACKTYSTAGAARSPPICVLCEQDVSETWLIFARLRNVVHEHVTKRFHWMNRLLMAVDDGRISNSIVYDVLSADRAAIVFATLARDSPMPGCSAQPHQLTMRPIPLSINLRTPHDPPPR